MLKMKDVALLDIGSSKISLVYGNLNGNSADIVANVSMQYSGFMDGEFFEEDKLFDIVASLLDQVESRVGKKLRRKIYVAVPGEFIMVDLKKQKEQFPKPKVISNSDWDELIDRAEESSNNSDYVNIGSTGLAFEADSYKPLSGVSGEDVVTRSITATISCIMCKRKFVSLFGNILDGLGVKEAEYISESFAEALYLTTKKERDKGILLCDIGYLTTTVMFVKGNGLWDVRSFSKGGAHIIADLVNVYKLDFKSAESLYRRINLKIDLKGGEMYRFDMPTGVACLPMQEVNSIAEYELDLIVKYIKKSIECFGDVVNDFMPIFFTGGGICTVKGAMDYVAHKINRKFDIRTPNVVQYCYPWHSSLISSMDLACQQEGSTNVIKKFFNKLFGG